MMKSCLVFLSLLTFTGIVDGPAQAVEFNDILEYFTGPNEYAAFACPSQKAADECSAICNKRGGKYQFKIDANTKTLTVASDLLIKTIKECSVFDGRNWQCEWDSNLHISIKMYKGRVTLTSRSGDFSCFK